MIRSFARLMIWWVRKWYPACRFLGRVTGTEAYIETAIETTEENAEQLLNALEEDS